MSCREFGRQRCIALVVGIVVCGAGSLIARAADLTSAERQHYDSAKKYLAQLQQNLKLARDAAGAGEDAPPASKAKLAQARLDTARQSAANVAARLEKLPTDHADVKTLQTDYDTTMKAIEALEERLAGKGNGKPAGAAPAADAPPLDYRAREAFKIARSNVDAVTASADKLDKVVADVNAAKDQSTIPSDMLSSAFGAIESARRQAGNAETQFKNVPANHPTVKQAADDLRAAVARIDAAEKTLKPLREQAMKEGEGANYANLKADNERLQELASSLATGNLQSNRAAAAETVKQLPALKEESARLLKKYEPLLRQKTPDSENLKNSAKRLDHFVQQYEAALAREKDQLPKQIESDLAQANKLAEQGVKEKKPAFFTGGVAQNLGFAEDRLILYDAVDPGGAKPLKAKLDQAREDVKKQEASLADVIIAANAMPDDKYSGPDKADLVKRATDAVKKQNPKAEVLAVRFASGKWQRDTKWRYENREWRKIDRSRIQAQVIVKRDDKLAEVRPINLWTDHMNNDAPSATALYGEKDELPPSSLMLVSKVN
jgi:myosin heavy subunit